MNERSVIVDCDTGVDDALALLLALRASSLNVIGITTLAGNVRLERVLRNTLIVVEHSGKRVPVYRGQAQPLFAPLETAEYAHGHNGLADQPFAEPTTSLAAGHAVDYLIETFMSSSGDVELVTTGPLTNIGLALMREPRLGQRIPRLTMMAGGITHGNATAAAEFNVYVDPEAADVVFRSAIPKVMIALEPIANGATLAETEVEQLETSPSPWCQMASRLLRWYLSKRPSPVSPCDPAAMAVALDPSIAVSEPCHVVIETEGKHTRGMTLVDRRPRLLGGQIRAPANVDVVLEIDTAGYRELFIKTLLTG